MREAYKTTIEKLYKEYNMLVTVVADSGTNELDSIRNIYPERFIECGISECNAVGVAAGLAATGCVPILYGMAPFLIYRAFEFIRDDICLQNLNVIIVGSGAGIIYNNLGPTHHATEDIALMRVLPNMTILSPASPKEVEPIMKEALKIDGPIYIRFGKSYEKEIYDDKSPFEFKKEILLKDGSDATIIGTGSILEYALEAANKLEKSDFHIRVINMATIKPLNKKCIIDAAKQTNMIITLEEHNIIGGLGEAVAGVLSENGIKIPFKRMGFNDEFCKDYGWYQDLKSMYGLDVEGICKAFYQLKNT